MTAPEPPPLAGIPLETTELLAALERTLAELADYTSHLREAAKEVR